MSLVKLYPKKWTKSCIWKSQTWPLHSQVKVGESIVIPMVLCHLPLMLCVLATSMCFTLWQIKENVGLAWVAWKHVYAPKRLREIGILNIYDHRLVWVSHSFEVCLRETNHGKCSESWWTDDIVITNHLLAFWPRVLDYVRWHHLLKRYCKSLVKGDLVNIKGIRLGG